MGQENHSLKLLASKLIVQGVKSKNKNDQSIINLSCALRGSALVNALVSLIYTDSLALKLSILDLIGLAIWKQDKTIVFLEAGLQDALSYCVIDSSIEIFYKVLWITTNLLLDVSFSH